MEINLSNLFTKRNIESRSLSAENFRGEKEKGGMATAETALHPGSANCARELGHELLLSDAVRSLHGLAAEQCRVVGRR